MATTRMTNPQTLINNKSTLLQGEMVVQAHPTMVEMIAQTAKEMITTITGVIIIIIGATQIDDSICRTNFTQKIGSFQLANYKKKSDIHLATQENHRYQSYSTL